LGRYGKVAAARVGRSREVGIPAVFGEIENVVDDVLMVSVQAAQESGEQGILSHYRIQQVKKDVRAGPHPVQSFANLPVELPPGPLPVPAFVVGKQRNDFDGHTVVMLRRLAGEYAEIDIRDGQEVVDRMSDTSLPKMVVDKRNLHG
jgi:hypothetical protein